MQSNDLMGEIGRMFEAPESVQIITALRQDPLVWESLSQADFLAAAVEQAGNRVEAWSPGRLALVAVGETRTPELLRAEPMVALGQTLHEKAVQTYQMIHRAGTPPASLREAGLLALALRERRRLTGTWSGLLNDLLPRQGQADAQPAAQRALWRAPLACLYALVPDPLEMLKALLPKMPLQTAFEWIAHARLSQPASDEAHVECFQQLLTGLPVPFQLGLLRGLSLRGREDLASALAGRLLIGHPAFASLRAQSHENELDVNGLAGRALALQQMGTFYQLSGDLGEALSLFDSVEVALDQWLAGLHLQRLCLKTGKSTPRSGSTRSGGQNTGTLMGSRQVTHLATSAGWLKNELGVVVVSHPYASSILEQVPGDADNAFLQLKRAARMAEQEPALARDLARQGAAGILEEVHRKGTPFTGEFVYTWRPQDALQILLELDLPEEALTLAIALLEERPTDRMLLNLTSQIYNHLGDQAAAVRFAQNVAALEPHNPEWQRALGSLWQQAGAWEQALEAWQTVVALTNPSSASDRLACAEAALKARRAEEAASLAQSVLDEDPNSGLAHSLKGQVLSVQGEHRTAVNHLVRATLLTPDSLVPWLALARAQQALDEPHRALETLRAAVAAVPDAPEGHLALGRACVEAALPAEALPHLKKAFQLAPQVEGAALLYGRTLRVLGHAVESRQVLERVRSDWTTSPELAYEYAQVLLDLNDAENALPVLEMALRGGLPVLNAYLLYARILMGAYRTGDSAWEASFSGPRLDQAYQALRHILEIEPDNLEARFLMADILREQGNLQAALDLYRDLSETCSIPELRWRVQWGLARTALRLGQVDMALVAFKEACQVKPDNLPLLRELAEASLMADLPKEALDAADEVLDLGPDDLTNLNWYAGFVAGLGEAHKAVDALDRAVQIDPDRPDLRVDLAQWQLSSGDLAAARASLEAVVEMDRTALSDLRRAAQLYLRLEDPQAALVCFERALALETNPPADMLLEMAQLQAWMGNQEEALELSQRALEADPDNLPIFLLQADLLARLNRPQAALALLERALRIAQVSEGSANAQGVIHERFTRLMIQAENYPAALHHAEKALALRPNDPALAYQAADLALALLQNERAARIIQSVYPMDTGLLGDPQTLELMESGQAGMDLICLKAETGLLTGRETAVSSWIDIVLAQCSDPCLAVTEARLLAVKSRLAARRGDIAGARGLLETASGRLGKSAGGLWLAEAALEAEQWKIALPRFESYTLAHPSEARGHLGLARALVLSAERQRTASALHCRTNAPGPQALDENSHEKFEMAAQAAGRLVNGGEVARWQARGLAVFTSSAASGRALAALPAGPEETAALIMVLRALNNPAAAVQVSRRYAEDPHVLLQLALCYLNTNISAPAADATLAEGIAVAERAAAADANQPLVHAALALLLCQAGQRERALEEYETALNLWANEPAWHDAAGDLCLQTGQVQPGIRHRQQALDLVPENARFAYKLGEAYLASGDIDQATACLEKSTAMDANQADVWLSLSGAYHMAGRLPQALEAARHAADLDPSSAQGLMIAGETAVAMNRVEPALDYAREAKRREPENAGVILFLSNVLVMRGQAEEGLSVLEEAPVAVKSVFPVAFERARLIRRIHGPQAAIEVLEKLAKEHPEEPDLLGFLAQTQAECGEYKAAERNAFKALRINPNQPELTLMLGRLQRKTGQLDQAVHLLSEAIRMAPERLDGYLELSAVYQERREYPSALQILRQAMRVAPGDYQAFYQSGIILRDSKDYAGSESMLRRAAELAPDNLSIRRQLVGVIALNLVHQSKQEVSLS